MIKQITALGIAYWIMSELGETQRIKNVIKREYFEDETLNIYSIGAIKKTQWFEVYDMLPKNGKNGKSNLSHFQDKTGVYLIKEGNEIIYVGSSSSNLYKTILRHFQKWKDDAQKSRITYKNDLWLNYKVRIILCPGTKAYELEKTFIHHYKPRDNKFKYDRYFEDIPISEIKEEIKTVNNSAIYYPPDWD